MKRNPNSNRSKRWVERNRLSSDKCASYIKDLCEAYNLKYKISNDKLFIDADGISYRVYPDYENICIIAINKKTGEKKWYDGDSCWVDFVLDIL